MPRARRRRRARAGTPRTPARPRGGRAEHEVVPGRQGGGDRPERLAEHPLHAVALDRPADAPADRYPEPRILRREDGLVAFGGAARKGVEDQVARGERVALAEHPVEVGAARQPPATAPAPRLTLAGGRHRPTG